MSHAPRRSSAASSPPGSDAAEAPRACSRSARRAAASPENGRSRWSAARRRSRRRVPASALPTRPSGCRKVRLPTMPCGSGTLLRRSSAGVPIAPPAAMNVFARTLMRRAVGSVPRASRPTQSSAVMRSPCCSKRPRPCPRHQRRTAIQHRGNGRHEHRLLGVGRTAHAAVADVPAAFHVAPDRAGRDAQRLRAAAKHVVVRVGLDRPGGNVEPRFHAFEPRCEIGRGENPVMPNSRAQ